MAVPAPPKPKLGLEKVAANAGTLPKDPKAGVVVWDAPKPSAELDAALAVAVPAPPKPKLGMEKVAANAGTLPKAVAPKPAELDAVLAAAVPAAIRA